MRMVTVAATQMACTDDRKECVDQGEKLIRQAADQGANIILLQELFEGHYFCQGEDPVAFKRALPVEGHPTIEHFKGVAKELGVVLPVQRQ